MKVFSLSDIQSVLTKVEIEIELIPGLPQITIIGLPDQGIKESASRVMCALRTQGFELPKNKQILINISPHYDRQSSKGIDLAIAVCYLLKTGQISVEDTLNKIFYGELSLNGQITEPTGLKLNHKFNNMVLVTGSSLENSCISRIQINKLDDFRKILPTPERPASVQAIRPSPLSNYFDSWQARWLTLVAAGNHSSLLAGPAGSGKTTLAHSVAGVLSEIEVLSTLTTESGWSPVISPHHSITTSAFIGGGASVRVGELTRANKGILIMDEMYEFKREVLESLREPMDFKKIRLGRGTHVREFPADFQLIGTTNLCPCGSWIPGKERDCSFSNSRCFSTIQKVSGPLLDRIEILYFTERKLKGSRQVSYNEVIENVDRAVKFRVLRMGEEEALIIDIKDKIKKLYDFDLLSERRRNAFIRVARTLADIDNSHELRDEHIHESWNWSVAPFLKMKA